MYPGLHQLVRVTRVREIVGDVIRVFASGIALGDMAEVENTDGETYRLQDAKRRPKRTA